MKYEYTEEELLDLLNLRQRQREFVGQALFSAREVILIDRVLRYGVVPHLKDGAYVGKACQWHKRLRTTISGCPYEDNPEFFGALMGALYGQALKELSEA